MEIEANIADICKELLHPRDMIETHKIVHTRISNP